MINEEDISEPIEITDLITYLEKISELRKEILDSVENKRLFFRGQENINWNVYPSIFRDNFLKNEAKILKDAFNRNPSDFRDHISPFERLTKLQHYGLCTRLLDVTYNPMVALYFACQKCMDIKNEIDTEGKEYKKIFYPNGVVYCKIDYENRIDSIPVKILSTIAELDFENVTIKKCIDKLTEIGIFNVNNVDTYTKNDYRELIKILQGNYFVLPNFNNERLVRQSGAFLLPGCINIIRNDNNICESVIKKAKISLNNEFNTKTFEIPADAKENILAELDQYNINEASLFPELEHQMKYIKTLYSNASSGSIDTFLKIEWNISAQESETTPSISPLMIRYDSDDIKEIIRKTIDEKKLSDISNKEIYDIFENNLVVDWYKKDQVISNIRKEIKHNLVKKYSSDISDMWANSIVNEIIDNIHNMNGN